MFYLCSFTCTVLSGFILSSHSVMTFLGEVEYV
jgi:hypothetical protein